MSGLGLLPARIAKKLRVTDSGCWEWTGAKVPGGYGRVRLGGNMLVAHRAVWALLRGAPPDELLLCHRCDNPPCCNPEHIFLGTQADNAQDASRKGRYPKVRASQRGEGNARAKLTEALVIRARQMWASGVKLREIRAELGGSMSALYFAISGRTWKCVPIATAGSAE